MVEDSVGSLLVKIFTCQSASAHLRAANNPAIPEPTITTFGILLELPYDGAMFNLLPRPSTNITMKTQHSYLHMAKALRLVVMVLCLGMIALPYVNATSGFYSHEGTQMKYIWSKVLAGECDERTIANDFEDDGKSPCVDNLGFASQDLVPIIIGLLVLILQFRKLMSPEDKPVKSTRFAKAKMVIGVTFFVVIIADWAGLLSPNGEMMDWAIVVGAPLPNAMFHGIFAVVGLQS